MSKRLLLAALVSVAVSAQAAPNAAAPASYRRRAGGYYFVMLAPDAAPITNPNGVAYPHSGLYAVNGSTAPLWTVDWYAQEVYVSPDGEHLARVESRVPVLGDGRPDAAALAVAFYERGRQLALYPLRDLIDEPGALPTTDTAARWAHSVKLMEARGLLRIKTADRQTLEFSMADGALLARRAEPAP